MRGSYRVKWKMMELCAIYWGNGSTDAVMGANLICAESCTFSEPMMIILREMRAAQICALHPKFLVKSFYCLVNKDARRDRGKQSGD